MFRPVNLNTTVRPDQRVPPEDPGQVRFALSHLGLFDPARDPNREESLMGGGMRRALGAFQAGQGLREDSILRPGGPTEQRLNLLLERNQGLRVTDPDDALTLERQATRERAPGALVGRVGPGLENHPDDVAVVGDALRQLGHIKPGAPRPANTGEVFGGIEDFQRATGLERNSIIAPDGPTEQLMARSLAQSAPGPRGIGAPTPLINATEASFRDGPAEPSPAALPTDRQRSGFVHPLARLSQQRRRQADETVSNPQLSAEQREAQRRDALRMSDRIIQREVSGPLTTNRSSDQVGMIARERDFLRLSPEEQDRERARLRQIAALTPEEQRAEEEQRRAEEEQQKAEKRRRREAEERRRETEELGDSVAAEGRRRTRRVLDGIKQLDRGERPRTVFALIDEEDRDKDAEFLVSQFKRLEPDAQAKTRLVLGLATGSDQQGLRRFQDLHKRAIAGTGKDKVTLDDELRSVLMPADELDNNLIRPFLGDMIIRNLVSLDPEGLGPDLGFVAKAARTGLGSPVPALEGPQR